MLPRSKWEFRATSYSFFWLPCNHYLPLSKPPSDLLFHFEFVNGKPFFNPAAYYLIYYLSERFFTHNSQARDLLYIWGKRLLPTNTFLDCYRLCFPPAGAAIELWAVSVRSRKIRNCYWNDYFSLYHCVGDSHVQKIHKSCARIRFSLFFFKKEEKDAYTHTHRDIKPSSPLGFMRFFF